MKILLVRLRLIGDVVFTTPLVGALRRRYPDAHLAYVVEPVAAAVVRGNPHLNEVMVVPRHTGFRRLRDDLSLARRLRRERFDIAIDLHGGPRSSWLMWASRTPMRIGYRTTGRSWMYTHVVPRPADLSPHHSVLKQWELLAPLGINECDRTRDAVEMPENVAAVRRIERVLAQAAISPDDPLIVVHVSAGNPFRRWPQDHFASLIAELARREPQRRFMVTSGPSDADAARAIVDRIKAVSEKAASAVSHAQFDVDDLRALVARATAFIGGDSGPLHIASTTRTPIVALFGPTLAERSMPWRDPRWFAEAVDAGPLPCRPCRQRTCEPGDFRCLTRINPESVVAAVERALAAANAGAARRRKAVLA
ncbi:MAG TPA: glycosyltransferase family 9 protein [Vicinamibacterales bacterium]